MVYRCHDIYTAGREWFMMTYTAKAGIKHTFSVRDNNSTQAVTNLLVHGHMFTSIRGNVTLYSLVAFAQTCHKGLDYTLIIFCMHRHNLLVSLWRICIVHSINIVCSFVLYVNKAHWELDRWCFIPLLEAFPLQMVAGYGNTDHNTLNAMHLLRQ